MVNTGFRTRRSNQKDKAPLFQAREDKLLTVSHYPSNDEVFGGLMTIISMLKVLAPDIVIYHTLSACT